MLFPLLILVWYLNLVSWFLITDELSVSLMVASTALNNLQMEEYIMVRLSNPAARVLENPRWVTSLFSRTDYAWVWLIIRVYVGWNWLELAGSRLAQDDR